MNITIDDTSPNLVWDGDWKAQAPNQIAINDNYFLDTYHAVQTKGGKASITFVGSAIYVYGSTGPNHGNYSVSFDNAIKFSPGFSTQTLYRQLLFSHVFGTTFDQHNVVLQNEEDFWLDLDFMVLTINTTAATSTSDIGFFTSTVSPATSVPLPTSSGAASGSSDSSSSIDPIFRTLTFILAAAIAVIVLLLVGLCIWRRRRNNPANRGWQEDKGERVGDHEPEALDITSSGGKTGSRRTSLLGFTRQSRLLGQDPLRSPSTARSATMEGLQSPFNPPSFRSSSVASSSKANQSLGATRESVTGSHRGDGLIALNNMGTRPKYRAVPSDGYDARERGGTPNATRPVGAQHHRGVGASDSGSGSGSGGAVNSARERSDSDLQARFKGYAGRSRGESVTNQSDTNISVLSSATTRIQHQIPDAVPNTTGFAPRNLKKEEDNESVISTGYATSGIGLGIYSQSTNPYAGSNADHLQRVADLKRSVSVASSGIVDRLGTSPPPVPELPLASSMGTEASLYSQMQTANEGYGYNSATISGAAKIRHPYGKNNEMLIYGNKVPETGAQPLRPPPLKRASQTRLRSSSGSLSNMLAQSQSGSPESQTLQTPPSANKNAENRYSRPPPSYSPSDRSSFLGMASQSSILAMPSQASSAMQSQVTIPTSGTTHLQRSTTRTGDIPIGIEGFNSTEFEAESQDSHSVAHAEVQMAKQINVNKLPSVAPLNLGRNPTQYERSDLSYAQPPLAPPSQTYVNSHTSHTNSSHTLQEQRKGAMAPTIGQFASGPQVTTNRRARTPESNRSYTPDRTMVVPGDRSYTPERVPAADRYGGGRPSEDRVWTLDGISQVGGQGRPSLERQRQPPPSLPPPPIGAPIMDDRTRNALAGSPARNLPRRP